MRWTGSAAERLRRGLRRLPVGATRTPTVSAIVTVGDGQRELLEACLASLEAQEGVEVDTHIVAHGPGAEHATLGEAREAALSRAGGEFLLFLGADETLRPGALAALTERLASGADIAAGGREQESVGQAVEHPDRSGVRLVDVPELVGDLAWGSTLFRRSFWDERVPAHPAVDADGLDALLVRAHLEARRIELLGQVVCERADPAAGLPFGQVLAVMDGVHEWAQSLAEVDGLLSGPELVAVRRAWLASLLRHDAVRFLDDVPAATPEQWDVLREIVPPLVDEAGDEVLAALPWQTRTKLWLLAQDRRGDIELLLHQLDWEGPSYPTQVREGRVCAAPWPSGGGPTDVPDRCLEPTPAESPLVASARMVRWPDPATLDVDLFAYVSMVADGTEPPRLDAALVDDAGQRVALEVEHAPSMDVTRFAAERYHCHDAGGFRLRVRLADLAPGRWRFDLTLTSNGVTRSGTVTHRELNGLWGERPRRLASGRLWGPSPDGQAGVLIEVTEPTVVAGGLVVSGRTVSGRLTGEPVARVVLERGGHQVTADVDATGRFELTVPPASGKQQEWSLRAVTREGDHHPVAYPAQGDAWLGDDAGELAWHRSRDGEAAVHEVARRAEVADVALSSTDEGDEAVVTLSWLGAVPLDWSLSLDSPRVRLSARDVATEGRRSVVRIPLRADEWGLGTTAAPPGPYRAVLTVDGSETELGAAEGLLTRTPLDEVGAQVRVRWRRNVRTHLIAQIGPPLRDEEFGGFRQRALREAYRKTEYELDPHAVYFQSYGGQTATDSGLAIHEHLRDHYPHLTLHWGINDHSVHVPDGAVPVLIGTQEWLDVLGRATYLVFNADFDKFFRKRPGQQVLQTFHGYPAKAMGLMQWRAKRFPEAKVQAELDRTIRTWDVILTPTPEMDEYYRREYAYDGPILNQGYPRDDVLVSAEAEEIRRTTRQRLGIAPHQKVVLYAPTFRDHLATDHRSVRLAAHLDLEQASAALGEDYVLLMRGHRFHARGAERLGRGRRLVDVTDYPEINDLILAADAAVLDYSSLRFDFALTRKPMVFLVPDLDVYSGPVRGFLYDYASTAPGPLLSDATEVVDALRDLDGLAARYVGQVETFLETYQRWQDGHATERVVRAFFGPPLGEA